MKFSIYLAALVSAVFAAPVSEPNAEPVSIQKRVGSKDSILNPMEVSF